MLDNRSILSVVLPALNESQNRKALIIRGCSVSICEDKLYSEYEELNSYILNYEDGNMGYGAINIEISFNGTNFSYFPFWIRCIAIRFNCNDKIKLNAFSSQKCYSKITKEGNTAVSMTLFLPDEHTQDAIEKFNHFLIEGNIAIDKKSNVYAFAIELAKDNNNQWQMLMGDTFYLPNTNIDSFVH